MRYLIATIIGILILGAAGGAWALQGVATGTCDGTNHVVTIEGFTVPAYDGDFTGLVLVRTPIGVCRAPETVTDPPLPFDPQPGPEGMTYTATAVVPAPAEAAVYRYVPYAVRPDGSLESLLANCSADLRSYALVACDDVPLARGTVAIDPQSIGTGTLAYVIENCADDCWTENIEAYLDGDTFSALAGEPVQNLLGATVDVYGTRTYCTMAGGDYHTVTRIERTTGGVCGAVPDAPTGWGELKALYR